jgi:hypothetical protein
VAIKTDRRQVDQEDYVQQTSQCVRHLSLSRACLPALRPGRPASSSSLASKVIVKLEGGCARGRKRILLPLELARHDARRQPRPPLVRLRLAGGR